MNSESVNNNDEHKKRKGVGQQQRCLLRARLPSQRGLRGVMVMAEMAIPVSNAVLFNRRSLSRRRSGNALLAGPNAKIDYKMSRYLVILSLTKVEYSQGVSPGLAPRSSVK